MNAACSSRPPRRYLGSSADERAAGRRERLLQAATAVYGESGFHASTIKDVCDAAGLTKRYFYESFTDAETLLAACFRRAAGTLVAELADDGDVRRAPPGDRARAILTAYFHALRANPKRARLFLLETDGLGPGLVAAMREAQDSLAELILDDRGHERDEPARTAFQRIGAVAGVARISSTWIAGDFDAALEAIVDGALALFSGLIPSPAASS